MISPIGLPRKVIARAYEVGVHADCMIAGYEGSCPACRSLIFSVLYEFYGDRKSSSEIATAITVDLLEDMYE